MKQDLNKILLSKSNSNNIEEAKQEWELVLHKDNINWEDYQLGYYYKNPCHYNETDNCRCVLGSKKRTEISEITNKPKLHEHCRWVNHRNLDLKDNPNTNYSCICKEPIIYVYQISNKKNGNLIPENRNESGIGSNCIREFLPECYKTFINFSNSQARIIRPEKYCLNCGKKNNRKKLLPNEFQNCRRCPKLCSILDCKNLQFSKQLCKSHLGFVFKKQI